MFGMKPRQLKKFDPHDFKSVIDNCKVLGNFASSIPIDEAIEACRKRIDFETGIGITSNTRKEKARRS